MWRVMDNQGREKGIGATGPTGPTGPSGSSASAALVLLAESTISGSTGAPFATRNVTGFSGAMFQSDFDDYIIKFIQVLPSVNASGIALQLTANTGSTYIATGYQSNTTFAWTTNGNGSTQTTQILLSGSISNVSTNGGICGTMEIFNPLDSVNNKQFIGEFVYQDTNVTTQTRANVQGKYAAASGINGFQVIPTAATGNIVSGIVRVYGISH